MKNKNLENYVKELENQNAELLGTLSGLVSDLNDLANCWENYSVGDWGIDATYEGCGQDLHDLIEDLRKFL